MDRKAVGSTIDILFLTLAVLAACILLAGSLGSGGNETFPVYADRVAQNSLLALQKVPVGKFEEFSYSINNTPNHSYEKKINKKPITQLIVEDLLLNVKKNRNKIFYNDLKAEFSEKIVISIKKILYKLIGDRFGYRLIIRTILTGSAELEKIQYKRTIKNFREKSERICSESIVLYAALPQNSIEKDLSISKSSKVIIPLKITLELWRK